MGVFYSRMLFIFYVFTRTQLKTGNKNKALETISNYVEGKTFEPKSLYYSALVYKENKMEDKVVLMKSELQKSIFELGLLITKSINNL